MNLFIYDASWFIHWGYNSPTYSGYAFAGYPLGGVKALTSSILQKCTIMDDVIVCFDSPTNRSELWSGYKSHRPRSVAILNQAKFAYEMFMKAGIPCAKVIGYEGDDLISSYASKYRNLYDNIVIYSNDADLAHNVAKNTKLQAASVGGMDVTHTNFITSVQANEVIEYNTICAFKVLVADNSDKIPQFKSSLGMKGRKIYNLFVKWGNENLPAGSSKPVLFSDKKILAFFFNQLKKDGNLSNEDMEELNARMEVVFPYYLEDLPISPCNFKEYHQGNLQLLLSILDDKPALAKRKLKKVSLTPSEFDSFKVSASELRDGSFAAYNDLPIHDVDLLGDLLDQPMRAF